MHSNSPNLLASTPLLDAVHRDHPDVDLIALPPAAPRQESPHDSPSPAKELAETEAIIRALGRRLTGEPITPRVTWELGDYRGTVTPVLALRISVASAAPATVASVLASAGWTMRTGRSGPTHRLHADLAGRSIDLALLDTVLLATLRGRSCSADDDQARRLLTGKESSRG